MHLCFCPKTIAGDLCDAGKPCRASAGMARRLYEGRAYGITSGCIGVALVCWQRRSEESKTWIPIAVGISLSAAIAFHYFSVFVIGALLVGEAVRSFRSRRVDVRMLLALTIPGSVLIPHLPLIRAGQTLVKNFWSKAHPSTLYEYYLPAVFLFENVLILALVLGIGVHLYAFIRPGVGQATRRRMMTEEWVAALVLVVLPALVILASLLTVKMFVDRYVLWSAIGMGICLAVLLHKVLRGSQVAAVISVGAASPLVGQDHWHGNCLQPSLFWKSAATDSDASHGSNTDRHSTRPSLHGALVLFE